MQNRVDSLLTKQLTRIEMVRRGENTVQTTGRERIMRRPRSAATESSPGWQTTPLVVCHPGLDSVAADLGRLIIRIEGRKAGGPRLSSGGQTLHTSDDTGSA